MAWTNKKENFMTNPINMNNFSQSLNIATATGDEVVSLDKHITTSATDTDQIQAFIVSTWMASFKMICIQKIILSLLTMNWNGRQLTT